MSKVPDGLFQFGSTPVGVADSVIAAGGKWYYVDPAHGSASNDGLTPQTALLSVIAAEDKLRSGYHDGVFMIGGATADTITATLTWDKSYAHLIGLVPPTMYGIRNRILSSTATLLPMVTFSGNGCVIANIMFSHEGSNATTCARAVDLTGSRNYFSNCTFRQIGAASVLDASKRDIYINSSDGENYFYKCTFGTDTYDGSANAANFNMEFAASTQTARNVFDSCLWLGSGSSGASWIKAGASSFSSFQWVKDCIFYNNLHGSMNEMTQGFALNAACGGELVFHDTVYYGCATLETDNTGMILGAEVNAAGTTGKLLALTF